MSQVNDVVAKKMKLCRKKLTKIGLLSLVQFVWFAKLLAKRAKQLNLHNRKLETYEVCFCLLKLREEFKQKLKF